MDFILSLNHSAVEQYFQQLYPNYSVKRIECTQGQGNIYLEPVTEAICPDCGRECSKVHQRIPRSIREVPLPGQLYSTVHVDICWVKWPKARTAGLGCKHGSPDQTLCHLSAGSLKSLRDNQLIAGLEAQSCLDNNKKSRQTTTWILL